MAELSQLQISVDTLFDQDLICRQHVNGYRFSIDPVLLSHFTIPKNGSVILDLGAGCGVISLILAYRYDVAISKIYAMEIQDSLYELLKQNITENKYEGKIIPMQGDLKHILQKISAESIDHIYCNPPYFRCGSGRTNADHEAYGARHQIYADLKDIATAAKKVLVNKGTITICYPAKRMTELFTELSSQHLEIKKLQIVYSYPEADHASLVLVECIKNGGVECNVVAPFLVYEKKNGQYSEQMKHLYQPKDT